MSERESSQETKVYESLTPVQGILIKALFMVNAGAEHYLKRDLLSRQIAEEIHNLGSSTALERFGDPFKPLDPSKPITPQTTNFPFLRFVFVNFVQTFPFLPEDQRSLWQDKVQPVLFLSYPIN
jgi:hypothetical protein